MDFLCCVDQVGTLRALVAANGAVIKEIRRDSFGVPYHDSFPDFHLPIGFAGGLTDPDTGLVRFGWRDYDPTIGRFTALDPARDRRGDGDLYDYCMDDPVSRVDPTGLWSKENFDESKVSRDGQGQFAGTSGEGAGSGSGGGETERTSGEPQAMGDAAALSAPSVALVSMGGKAADIADDLLWEMANTRLGSLGAQWLAGKIFGVAGFFGDLLFPDEVSAPEKMYSIRTEAITIEEKIIGGNATEKDAKRLYELYQEEASLRKQFGNERYDGPAYKHVFPKRKVVTETEE